MAAGKARRAEGSDEEESRSQERPFPVHPPPNPCHWHDDGPVRQSAAMSPKAADLWLCSVGPDRPSNQSRGRSIRIEWTAQGDGRDGRAIRERAISPSIRMA